MAFYKNLDVGLMWKGKNGQLKTEKDIAGTVTPDDTFALFITRDGFQFVPGESGQLTLVHLSRPREENGRVMPLINLGLKCNFESLHEKAVYIQNMFTNMPEVVKNNGALQTPIALLYSMTHRLWQHHVLYNDSPGGMQGWWDLVIALNGKMLEEEHKASAGPHLRSQ
ncbi:hypothetical protein EV360DRAFT_67183 [Lentinula raphanica]|nr:hypothetical protein EV360DRAFT_67183 [Lentinula raphanica]